MNISSYTSYNQGDNDKWNSAVKKIGRAALRMGGLHTGSMQAKLEKAVFRIFDANEKAATMIYVQFNPSDFTVSRSLRVHEKIPIGKESDLKALAPSEGTFALFKTTLYVDTINETGDAIDHAKNAWTPLKDKYETKKEKLKAIASNVVSSVLGVYSGTTDGDCAKASKVMSDLLKYDKESHKPRLVQFSWGTFNFKGYLTSCSQTYTMFLPNGTPVREKMDITIKGEEVAYLQKTSMLPFESPDRTKQRTLVEGDQLWMMAYDEYSDPSMWKVIAKENGILNPRLVRSAADLSVPAIV